MTGPLRLIFLLVLFTGASGSRDSSVKVGSGALWLLMVGREGKTDFKDMSELGRVK